VLLSDIQLVLGCGCTVLELQRRELRAPTACREEADALAWMGTEIQGCCDG